MAKDDGFSPSWTLPPQPSTERGVTAKLDLDPTGSLLAYCAGHNVVLRSLGGNSDVFLYAGHGAKTPTCVKFSPNGNWIASGDSQGRVQIWGAKGERGMKYEYQLFRERVLDVAWDEESKRMVVGEHYPKFRLGAEN